MSKEIPFESIIVGEELGPIEYVISEKAVKNYCDDWKDFNPIYSESSSSGDPPTAAGKEVALETETIAPGQRIPNIVAGHVCPPAFRAGLDSFRLLGTKYDAHATLGFSTEHEFLNPITVGKRLIVTGKIIEKYVKRGIEYVIIQYSTMDEDGVKIRESVDHIALGVERVTDAG
jgi:hypothetical protein